MDMTKNNKIQFKEHFIHVIEDRDGAVIWVSLQDLCRVLKRREMLTNGKAEKLCGSATGFPIYSNGKLYLFINLPDILVLTGNVRKENKMIAKICDDLNDWVARLPLGRKGTPGEQVIITNPETKPADVKLVQKKIIKDNNLKRPADKHNNTPKKVLKKLTPEERTEKAVPVIFEYEDSTISFKSEDGKIFYNATQMAKSFGKNPRE